MFNKIIDSKKQNKWKSRSKVWVTEHSEWLNQDEIHNWLESRSEYNNMKYKYKHELLYDQKVATQV